MSFSGKLLQNIAPGKHSYTHFYTLSVDDYFSRVGRLIFPQVKGVFKKKKLAERGGFEPPYPRRRVNGFRDRRIQPLCHLSLCLQAYAKAWPRRDAGTSYRLKNGGESGIWTRDTLLAYTRFPIVLLQPLGQLSVYFSRNLAFAHRAGAFHSKSMLSKYILLLAFRPLFTRTDMRFLLFYLGSYKILIKLSINRT